MKKQTKLHFLFISCLFLLHVLGVEGRTSLIPTPQQVKYETGSFNLKPGMTIGISNHPSLMNAAHYLVEKLEPATGYRFPIRKKGKTDILLDIKALPDTTPGAYQLRVTAKRVVITANNYNGIISGISTLRQLLPEQIERNYTFNEEVEWTVPCVTVTDAPRFQYRGLMLDVARHYFDKEEIKVLLDRMALYKLNKFHWHLTDNEGWRIEIKRYPKLTQESGWRLLNGLDQYCENRAQGDNNPEFNLTKKHLKTIDGKVYYGGFYTQKEIKEVVAYASKLGIDVIPEIDMPGHFNAASAVYPEVICPKANMSSSPVCAGNDSAIEFCKNVYSEVFALFPNQDVHIGADEVGKENWKDCPSCQKRIKDEGLKDEKELQSWFVHTMEKFFREHGKRLIGWDEITEGGLSNTSTVMWWTGSEETLNKTLSHGNKIIMTPNQWLYFDHGQNNSSAKHVFEYDPIPESIQRKDLIAGVQANIWGEYIPSMLRVDYMSMPKMLCLSEVAWVLPTVKNWDTFSTQIEDQIPRLDMMGINYRVPELESDIFISKRKVVYLNVPPQEWLCDTIMLEHGKRVVDLKAPYPGIQIRYTTDGTIPTIQSTTYATPFTVTAPSEYMFATFRPNGTRGEFRKVVFVQEK